jgi:hypothetical protein
VRCFNHKLITELREGSNEEAGHYLSTFKQFEHRPPDMIKGRIDSDYRSRLRASLTSISKVNKTDAETLRTTFGVCILYFFFLLCLLSQTLTPT